MTYIDADSTFSLWKTKYPHTFKTTSKYFWGPECSGEWLPVIEKLLYKINDYHSTRKEDPSNPFMVDQIKEKFGSLRVYCSGTDKTIDAMISAAEKERI